MQNEIEFTILPGVGPGEIKTTGTLIDLLEAIPYLLSHNTVPPFHVINNLLLSGEEDCGMSGGAMWEPFSLSREQYENLSNFLIENRGLSRDDTLEQMTDYNEWVIAILRK
jgi:hypothetical protein